MWTSVFALVVLANFSSGVVHDKHCESAQLSEDIKHVADSDNDVHDLSATTSREDLVDADEDGASNEDSTSDGTNSGEHDDNGPGVGSSPVVGRSGSACCKCNDGATSWSVSGKCNGCLDAGGEPKGGPYVAVDAPYGCRKGEEGYKTVLPENGGDWKTYCKEYCRDEAQYDAQHEDFGGGEMMAEEDFEEVHSCDIGQFAEHAGTPGIGFLNGAPLTLENARMVVDALNGSWGETYQIYDEVPLVSEAGRRQLVNFVDEVVLGDERDVKRKMTLAKLSAMIGDAAASNLLALFHDDVHQIQVRRAEAHGDCINFHLDHSQKTLQVPLNSPDEYEGGRLAYITAKGVEVPDRPAGCATIHDNSILHGVTRMQSGVRYGLFLQKLRS